MVWLAKCIDGTEYIFDREPYKEEVYWQNPRRWDGDTIMLPKGTIEKIIGREFKWNDNPVEIKEDK